jgi:GTPase
MPYTGLKPAGRDLGPAIPTADKAVEAGDAGAVERLLTGTMKEGLGHRMHAVLQTKAYDAADVAAGREHVGAYAGFVHYVDGIYQTASAMPHEGGHATE